MTQEDAKLLLPIIKAYSEGKEIEYFVNTKSEWDLITYPIFDDEPSKYRIKTESNMKPFNLEEYLKNPSQKVVTRNGKEVRIICTDSKQDYPIIALVKINEKTESTIYLKENGRWNDDIEDEWDLFFPTIKREGWVNIYECKNDTRTLGCLFSSEEEAIENKLIGHVSGYIKTIKIEWEE